MITTDSPLTAEQFEQEEKEYEENRLKIVKADGLRFVPEGDGKKHYAVACNTADEWKNLHDVLHQSDSTEQYVPSHHVECCDECKCVPNLGSFELTDAEAEELKKHSTVVSVALDQDYYAGTFKGSSYRLTAVQFSRYDNNVKNCRFPVATDDGSAGDIFYPVDQGNVTSAFLSRTNTVYRHSKFLDPFNGIITGGSNAYKNINDNPKQFGDGSDVDVIVGDESAWYAHSEFIKNGIGEPSNYVGGNVLRAGFSTSSTTGICGVLDLCLDAPYYIDPEFFEANPGARLETRWDGTKVPVESVARNWWRFESTTYRSAKYVSTDRGGTATVGSDEDFGTISINTAHTRARSNGSNTARQTALDPRNGHHGTPCMSQAYGKTYGYAYNANKWHLSIIWNSGSQTTETYFKLMNVFHRLKPVNPKYGTKDPTLSSNSWGARGYFAQSGHYFHRKSGNGGDGVAYTTKPNMLSYMMSTLTLGNHGRIGGYDTTDHVIGKELIDGGVLFFNSAGNNNQKQVLGDHPDYNNYVAENAFATLAQAQNTTDWRNRTRTIHRPGSPCSIGMVVINGVETYRSFNVGALDTLYNFANSANGERRAFYSNMGNSIDFYTLGNQSASAFTDPSTRYSNSYFRADGNYTYNGTTSIDSYDGKFGGTSSACPTGTGIVATVMQHNRNWSWSDVKNWLKNDVTNQPDDRFASGAGTSEPNNEPTDPESTDWATEYSLMGGDKKILWDAPTASTPSGDEFLISGNIEMSGPLDISHK